MAARGTSPAPRRNLTVPEPSRSRFSLSPSPPPISPPMSPPLPSRPSSAVSASRSEDVHPLQTEIDRLAALIDQHELKFRSSKVSFEHRVFSEFPSIIARFGEMDSRAEKATADLYGTLHQTLPQFEERLQSILDEREADVETMRERTTPWAAFLSEDSKDDMALKRVKSGQRVGRIERVRGAGAQPTESDALGMIERWADEVEMHLTEEIVRLKNQLGDENRKRVVIFQLSIILSCIAILALGIWWLRPWPLRKYL